MSLHPRPRRSVHRWCWCTAPRTPRPSGGTGRRRSPTEGGAATPSTCEAMARATARWTGRRCRTTPTTWRPWADGLPETPIVVGWSMGRLVAMMAAARGRARACVGLAPSTPAARRDEGVEVRPGVFGPEEYGITSEDPAVQPTMPDLDIEERLLAIESLSPESRTARDDRKAGIVIDALPCPLLVVTGSEDRGLAALGLRRYASPGRLPRGTRRLALGARAEPPRAAGPVEAGDRLARCERDVTQR